MMPGGHGIGNTNQGSLQQDTPKRTNSLQVQTITTKDLDVEDAAGDNLRSIQERQQHGRSPLPTPTAGAWVGANPSRSPMGVNTGNFSPTGVVQTRISRLEAAVRAQQSASDYARRARFQDMIAEEETGVGTYVSYTYSSPRNRVAIEEGDGLMKAAVAAHRNRITERNPYGSNYDHHFLNPQETSVSSVYDTSMRESQQNLGLFHRATQQQSSNNANPSTSTPSLPMHGDPTGHSTSDYIATNQDGVCYPGYTRESMYRNGRSEYSYPLYSQNSTLHGKQKRKKPLFPRWVREVCAMFHPYRVFANCLDILVVSQFLWVGFPCLLASAICFYLLGNPSLHVLPGETTIAVWLLFATRQTVTLGLARLTVYIVIDGLMLGTHLAVQTLGPLVTLAAATGNGWPAMMTTWGLWNFVLIHGDSPFQMNWLYWTGMGLFNLNFGGMLVNSVFYTRILLAAILGGLIVSAKRTIFALRFGRKQVVEFKPRLKRILADVVLLDEIATLAAEADKVGGEQDLEEGDEAHSWDMMMSPSIVQQNFNGLLWVPKIEYQNSTASDCENESVSGSTVTTPGNTTKTEKRTTFADSPELPSSNERGPRSPLLRRSDSGRLEIKDMLDTWAEPDAKTDKTENISIHEILKFRRALAHLEDEEVFGHSFGSTATRDKCIANSHSVYYRLLKMAEESDKADPGRIKAGVLHFDILALLCLGEDGITQNLSKKRKIRKLFTPDRSGELPLLAFVQAIDQCYKRLVFLRASLQNASLLDGVLEKLFNGIFYFILILMLSSLLQLHPWTLMVSLTSILVSVSFALGSSVSGYVEGVLLIAVRRPFDLGDRIFMSSADGINPLPDVTKNSWFVEDITLATTTLRYARTNEVCTVNNSSLASMRLVNLARSPNAMVHFKFASHISILDDNKLEQFRKEIQRYVEERPRVWEGVASIRHGMFDAGDQRVDISMALRHRNAWQECGRIKNDRADVFRFLYGLGSTLNIHFSAPPEQRVVYHGGVLQKGDADDGRDLLGGPNIRPLGSTTDAVGNITLGST